MSAYLPAGLAACIACIARIARWNTSPDFHQVGRRKRRTAPALTRTRHGALTAAPSHAQPRSVHG